MSRKLQVNIRFFIRKTASTLGGISLPTFGGERRRLDSVAASWLPIAWLCIIAATQIVAASKGGKKVELLTSERALFYIRSILSSPAPDPRIKIFTFDDRTAAELKSFDLTLARWQTTISAIQKKNPAWIYIDKLFDKAYSQEEILNGSDDLDRDKKVSIISFVRPLAIPHRDHIPPATIASVFSHSLATDATLSPPISEIVHAYGASMEFINRNSWRIGHALYEGTNRFRPAYYLGESTFLPHVGLSSATDFQIRKNGIFVDGRRITSTIDEELPINLGARNQFKKSSISLLSVINRAEAGMDLPVINEGDHVLILPAMYTGNTDWRETPFGSLPGGLILASIINSQLTGQWLSACSDPGFWVLVFSFTLLIAGLYMNTKLFFLTSGMVLGGYLFIAAFSFMFLHTIIPVTFCIAGGMSTTFLILISKEQVSQTARTRIRAELDAASAVQSSFVPPATLSAGKLQILSFTKPASECGGDWWNHRNEGDIHFVLIGDAIGHGMSAALVTAVSYAVTETLFSTSNKNTPADQMQNLFDRLNGVLLSLKSPNAQMTFQIARIDCKSGNMIVMSAAHTFPMIFPADKKDDRLKKDRCAIVVPLRGSFLGHSEKASVGKTEVRLAPGDRVVLYTDGIVENNGPGNKRALGRSGIENSVKTLKSKEFPDFFATLKSCYFDYMLDAEPADDATLVAIHFDSYGGDGGPDCSGAGDWVLPGVGDGVGDDVGVVVGVPVGADDGVVVG